ncbi:WD repeat-containing protein on Y chromosome-like [Haliotis rubra]|uniref:WD repeat-containing protein on Y chromosome-like n=1 Tax=Haliotis rubra TaxID=36100 RepID=UPI001EE5FE65|nr:WD repeat-containing protein on Y chromosome-like [Haliotis rubra]
MRPRGTTEDTIDSPSCNYLGNRRKTKAAGDINLHEAADNVKLNRLQMIFTKASLEGLPGLTLDEFKVAIRQTLHQDLSDFDLDMMFMKMDANCDGTIDWEEYLTYNLLEYKEKNQMMQMLREKPFPNDMKQIHTRHHEIIVRISFYPHLTKRSTKVDLTNGKYATLSRDGVLSFWTIQMNHVRSIPAFSPSDRKTQPWYVDMACLYNNNMLAVASTDRDITFFEMSTKKLVKRYMITGLEDCVTCLDCRADLKDRKHTVLIWGDTAGNLYSVNFEIQRGGAMFGSQDQKKDTVKKVSFAELLRGYVPNVKAYKLSNVHDDWVCKIQYVPELSCVLSCCQCSNTALFMGDFVKKKSPAYFKVMKGVLCFDYCPTHNIIATGGMDYNIRLFNPYVANRAIVILKGHLKPVIHTVLNGRKNMLISIDKGKTIRIYDLKDHICLQHISGRMVKLGPFPISALTFNRKLQHLILATNELALLEHKDEDEKIAEVISHTKPVVKALYNPTFNVMVSACEESVVSIWNIDNGEKIMQFINAHSSIENGVEIPVEITVMTFDTGGRRIITGARDGSVKVWNFNNGACLQKFQIPDESVITGIVSSKHRIYVAGWDRKVHIYVDGGGEESRKTWQTRHKEDILNIAYLSPNIIATSSYDGDIVIWARDTGHMYSRLNAHHGVRPIMDTFNRDNTEEAEEELEMDMSETPHPSQPSSMSTPADGRTSSRRSSSSSPRKSLRWGSRLGRLKEEEDGSNESTTPSKMSSTHSCEHPLLRALDTEQINSPSGKFKPRSKFSRDEYENICQAYEAAVEKIIFLNTREALEKKTAVMVTAGAEGWVRAWSLHHQGGLLGQFYASHVVGDSISTIATDAQNRYLFTADISGYVKVWDLIGYCTDTNMSQREEARHLDRLKEKFTFLRVESAYGQSLFQITRQARIFNTRPPPLRSKPEKSVKTPRLLNSFRAHVCPVNSIDFIEDRELIITASVDCAIRLWTICGRYIGTFGERWKKLPRTIIPDNIKRNIPKELRRAGSAKTLRVLNGGETPHWELAMKIVRQRGMEQLRTQFPHLQRRDYKGGPDTAEQKMVGSNILGKSYKRKVRHKLPPVLPKLIETPSTIAVYHSIPFVDLSPFDLVHPPEVIEEINKRRQVASIRYSAKQKGGVISTYNKVITKPAVGLPKQGPHNRLKKIISLHKRQRSRSGTPDTEDMRSTLTNCPSTVTSPSPDSRSSHGVKLAQID